MADPNGATRDLAAPARVAVDAAGGLTAAAFGLASRLRGTKVFHPHGVVHEATVTISGGAGAPRGASILSQPARYEALARFSRGAGLPRPLPDVLGMAVRLVDAYGSGRHQDFLLVTSGDGALVQHLLLPARSFGSLPYSSVLPYRAGGRLWLVGARMDPDASGAPDGDEFDRLLALASSGRAAIELCVAPLGGRLRAVGEITLGDRLDASANRIRFDPFNTGGGLEPVTVLNRLRAFAYPASQRGWDGAPPEALSAEGDDDHARQEPRRAADEVPDGRPLDRGAGARAARAGAKDRRR
jgi:hypothetical protein